MSEVVKKLQVIAYGLNSMKHRVVLEDSHGTKYEVAKVLMLGSKTDDPGLVLKIVRAEP